MAAQDTGSILFVGPKRHRTILRMARWVRMVTRATGALLVLVVVAGAISYVPLSLRLMMKPTDATSFWTLVTGVGTIGLCIVAAWGLNSLRLTRRDMFNRALRDARATAVARCEEFARDIIPLNAPLLEAMAREKTTVFVTNASDVRFVDVARTELTRASEWYRTAPAEVRATVTVLLNKAEAWSMYFTAQLADADVAYEPVGTIFCSMVIQYYPVLLLLRADPSAGNYTNIIALYEEWLARLSASERAKRERELLAQVAAIQERGPAGARIGKPLGYNP